MSDVHRQGALEDDVLHLGGLRIHFGEFAQFGHEAFAGGVGLGEGTDARFDD